MTTPPATYLQTTVNYKPDIQLDTDHFTEWADDERIEKYR